MISQYLVLILLLLNTVCDASSESEYICTSCRAITEVVVKQPALCEEVCGTWDLKDCYIVCYVLRNAITSRHPNPCAVAGLCEVVRPAPSTNTPASPNEECSPALQGKIQDLVQSQQETNALLTSILKDITQVNTEPRSIEDSYYKGSNYIVRSNVTSFFVTVFVSFMCYWVALARYKRDAKKFRLVPVVYQALLLLLAFYVLGGAFVMLFTLGVFPTMTQIYNSLFLKNHLILWDRNFATDVAIFNAAAAVFLFARSNLIGLYHGHFKKFDRPADLRFFKDVFVLLVVLFSSTYCGCQAVLLVAGYLLPDLVWEALQRKPSDLMVFLNNLYMLRVLFSLSFYDSGVAFLFYLLLCFVQVFHIFWLMVDYALGEKYPDPDA